jgi:hypothetical protein
MRQEPENRHAQHEASNPARRHLQAGVSQPKQERNPSSHQRSNKDQNTIQAEQGEHGLVD